ncbi:MAG: NeuD/PglB/VioB family sugar acetyltransferase [Lachnospiraceae bacterium]|nr:NeuD/PglB/VioB family sugar acetyltransferase [Lachnospiraceae bacterium]
MKKIVLAGGSGHCKVIIETLKELNIYDEIFITDENLVPGTKVLGCEVVGNDDCLQRLFDEGVTDAFVTVGSIKTTAIRRKLAEKIQTIGFHVPVIIDNTAVVASSAKIGKGTYIGKKAVINADCIIGNYSIINTAAVMEHECTCGDFCHVSIGAVCCGKVCLGNDVFVGTNATVIQKVSIPSNTIVGAGSLILNSIKEPGIYGGKVDFGNGKNNDSMKGGEKANSKGILVDADNPDWDAWVKLLPKEKQDVYFFSDYYKLGQGEGCGLPRMFVYSENEKVALYPFFLNEIPSKYAMVDYYDIENAYGYGGPVSNCEDESFFQRFELSFLEYCKNQKVVAEFIRFHPFLKNEAMFQKNIEANHNRTTVWLDLTRGIESLWMNGMSPRYRTKIRKAEKMGLHCIESKDYVEFMRLYYMTMKRNHAEKFYFFSEEYFKNIMHNEKSIILYILDSNEKIIAGNLLLLEGDYIHYHLGASDTSYLNYNANTYMLWKGAEYGVLHGCKKYHLGGGLSDDVEDNLFRFKSGFSKERADFYIGKRVHNQKIYDDLISKWILEKHEKPKKLLAYRD